MSKSFARPLDNNILAYRFLTEVLSLPTDDPTADKAVEIAKAETLIYAKHEDPTISSKVNRHPHHQTNEHRKKLRQRIFEELISLPRLLSDDNIVMGEGGARPAECNANSQAYIVTGLPASGKSTIANAIADRYGAFVLDSDYAKRKFPEMKQEFGADLVHEESSIIITGSDKHPYADEPCLFQYCVNKSYNIVIPKIGYDHKTLEELRDTLHGYGYQCHLTLVSLGRLDSTRRALTRFESTKRYVPLSLIFDGYSNDPMLAYYRTKNSGWSSTGKLSTAVPLGSDPVFIEGSPDNPAVAYSI